MTEGEAGERADDVHPLPELLDGVLNGGKDCAREGGWKVKRSRSGNVIMIGTYDEPPESGGWVENRAVFKP